MRRDKAINTDSKPSSETPFYRKTQIFTEFKYYIYKLEGEMEKDYACLGTEDMSVLKNVSDHAA